MPRPTTKGVTETEAAKSDSDDVVEQTTNDAVDREA